MIGIIVVAVVLAFGGWTAAVWNYSGDYHVAAQKEKQDAADAKIAEQAQQIIAQGEKGIKDKERAYEDGQAHGRVVIQTVTSRGAADVQRYEVFRNPQCVLPQESLALLNAARGSLRSGVLPAMAAEPEPIAPIMVSPRAPAMGKAVQAAPAAPPAAPTGVPTTHPKPKPVTK